MKHNLAHHSFKYNFYKNIMPFVYNIGAAVVIFGAMFKLLNLPGGSFMLGTGLFTEALIFTLSAFAPKEQEIDWSRVYPELAPNYKREHLANRSVQTTHTITQKFNECLEKASIDTSLLENLAAAMRRFSENMEKQTTDTNSVYSHLETALKAMESAGREAVQFKEALALLNEKITALNEIYANTLSAFKR